MALDATVGGASSNSFVTVAAADTYMDTRMYNTDWTGATTATKESALVTATTLLNELIWRGTKASTAQYLEFPRNALVDQNGFSIENDVIPEQVKKATYELALDLVKADRVKETGTEGFKSIKVGPLTLDIDEHRTKPVIADHVIAFVRTLMEGSMRTGAVPVLRT